MVKPSRKGKAPFYYDLKFKQKIFQHCRSCLLRDARTGFSVKSNSTHGLFARLMQELSLLRFRVRLGT